MLITTKRRVRSLVRKIIGPGEIGQYHHRADSMATKHNDGFRRDPTFVHAYARSVKASGWDYNIPYRIHQALWCSYQAQKVDGNYIELGTGRGFIMSAVFDAYPDWATSNRSAWLFDTFEPGWVEGDARGESSPFYAESFERVSQNFSEWPRVQLVQGDVLESLPQHDLGTIAFLHIDLNHPRPETFGLKRLWGSIPRGGVVLLDDYAYNRREAQYIAMNELAHELGISILSTATGQGIIIK